MGVIGPVPCVGRKRQGGKGGEFRGTVNNRKKNLYITGKKC